MTQAILVSLNFHVLIVSIIALIIFIIVNRSTIIKMSNTSVRIVRRKY